jgi:hypothetical protein
MGTGQSFECCKGFPAEAEHTLKALEDEEGLEKELSPSDYSLLSSHVRKVSLLSALNFATQQVKAQQQQLLDINSSFNLISRFIEVL